MNDQSVASLSARANVLARHKGANHPDTIDARRAHTEAAIAADIKRRLADAPPLTEAQQDRLAALIRGGGR